MDRARQGLARSVSPKRLSVVIAAYHPANSDLPDAFWLRWLELFEDRGDLEWIIVESFLPPAVPQLLPWLEEQKLPFLRLFPLPLLRPSRAAAFNYAILQSQGEQILLLHEDCLPQAGFLVQLEKAAPLAWGGFYKVYDLLHWGLSLSAWGQSKVFRSLGLLVGSNGLLFPKSFWKEAPFQGDFLEDLHFTTQARKSLGPPQAFGKIQVSARRYRVRGVLRTLFENLSILIAYRLRVPSRLLRRFYPPLAD